MHAVFAAVIPVFAVIWLGYFFKRIRLPGPDFWPLAEKITYYVFLPSLFFRTIMHADFAAQDHLLDLLLVIAGAMLFTSACAFLTQKIIRLDGKKFAAFFQATIRFNNYIGIPIILSLYGEAGLVTYVAIIALAIPLTNILSVAVMEHFAQHSAFHPARVFKSLAKNPLIIGSVAGLFVNLTGLPLFYAEDMLDILSKASIALGLLSVGAAIDLEHITSSRRDLALVSFLKLAINPLAVFAACLLLNIEGMTRDIAIIYAALPVATSSYILARQHGAHGPLAASAVVITTLICMLSLSALLLLLHS